MKNGYNYNILLSGENRKKIGVDLYYGRRKQIWYSIQGLLVRKSDKQKK